MNWKTKRLVGTALWSTVPYFVWSFTALDWFVAFSCEENRLLWLVLTACAAGVAYTYPFWSDEA